MYPPWISWLGMPGHAQGLPRVHSIFPQVFDKDSPRIAQGFVFLESWILTWLPTPINSLLASRRFPIVSHLIFHFSFCFPAEFPHTFPKGVPLAWFSIGVPLGACCLSSSPHGFPIGFMLELGIIFCASHLVYSPDFTLGACFPTWVSHLISKLRLLPGFNLIFYCTLLVSVSRIFHLVSHLVFLLVSHKLLVVVSMCVSLSVSVLVSRY